MAAAMTLAAVPGCAYFDSSSCEQGCTLSLAYVGVTVVDDNGNRVSGLTTKTVYVPTGAVLREATGENEVGYYVVLDDAMDKTQLLPGERHEIRFYAQGETGTAMADFVIRAGECVCHVEKLSGPDTLVLQPY